MIDTLQRLPLIRHIRYYVMAYKMLRHYDRMRAVFPLASPQQFEIDYLNAVWRGDAS